MRGVIILAIGNELLIGETLDTNTNWLCRQLTGLGLSVERACILPDRIEAIVPEVRKACDAGIDLLITTGGLGPTQDDLTLASIAQSLNLTMERNSTAYSWVEEKYATLAKSGYVDRAEMNPAREKMAVLPAGATPISNPVGAAPAIELLHNKTTIICLPGVPAELRSIFSGPLQPRIATLFGLGCFQERELWVNCGDESVLAPILKEISASHPGVFIKSKAKSFGPKIRFKIKIHSRGDLDSVTVSMDETEASLREALANAGIEVLSAES
jgi:nicotinamide-nucleotide amidase